MLVDRRADDDDHVLSCADDRRVGRGRERPPRAPREEPLGARSSKGMTPSFTRLTADSLRS